MKKSSKFIAIIAVLALVCMACVSLVACNDDSAPEETAKKVTVRYVADGTAAATLLADGQVDFMVVGEPAASAQTKRLSLNAEMNMQSAYKDASGATNYPQAGIFVQSALAGDEEFLNALFEELAANKVWIAQNKANVTTEAKKVYESANFPAIAIDRCAVNGEKLTEQSKNDVLAFLANVMPSDDKGNAIEWSAKKSQLFDISASEKTSNKIRFSAPEGTPALAMLTLASNQKQIGAHEVEYAVVNPANIASEMATKKSQVVIMPVNAGAKLISNGADYKLVSIAVDGSLYMVGNTEKGGQITFDDIVGKKIACIGQTGVPGLIFRYVMQKNGIEIVTE